MSYKKFSSKDLVYNTIVAEPKYTFTIHNEKVTLQKQQPEDLTHRDSFPETEENRYLKHFNEDQPGSISLHELNVDRHKDSMIYAFVEKSSTRQAFKSVSTTEFDAFGITDEENIPRRFEDRYPLTASLTRIFVSQGDELEQHTEEQHSNRRYIRSLKNPLSSQFSVGSPDYFQNILSSEANILCIPGIFYGSSVSRGSIELGYYIDSNLLAKASDKYKDGRIMQTYADHSTGDEAKEQEKQIGVVLYNQGLIVLYDDDTIKETAPDGAYFSGLSANTKPRWTDFGTGARLVSPGDLSPGAVSNTTYTLSFKGINKIPTLMMYMYSKHGEDNYSHNPTFIKQARMENVVHSRDLFYQKKTDIKEVNKSPYSDYDEDFENNTYISKIGIYDEHQNLIAIASLANPVKKTEKRDFMFKANLDF